MQSCNHDQKVIAERLSITDSVAINFFKGDGTMDTVVRVKMIRDKEQIKQLSNFISSSSAPAKACGVDGSIHFFRNDLVLQDIDFRMNDADCMHFHLQIDGEWFTTELSKDAKAFLLQLKSQN